MLLFLNRTSPLHDRLIILNPKRLARQAGESIVQKARFAATGEKSRNPLCAICARFFGRLAPGLARFPLNRGRTHPARRRQTFNKKRKLSEIGCGSQFSCCADIGLQIPRQAQILNACVYNSFGSAFL
jgi:hypothetical protein